MAGGKTNGRRAAGWLAAVCLAFSCCVPAAADSTAGEVFVSERISRNYTKVSAGYTLPAYTGEEIRIAPEEAVTDAGSAEWTGKTMGYPAAQVLRVRYGDTVRMKAEIPEDGLYAVRLDYYSYDHDAEPDRQTVLPDRIALTVDGSFLSMNAGA